MNNEKKIQDYWRYTRNKLRDFNRQFIKISNKTKINIQDIFNSLNITYQDLNKTIPKQLKEKVKLSIEKWKEKGLYNGYFKARIEQLSKNNINYRQYIEIMLYGVLIEELASVDDISNLMFTNIELEYYNKGKKDLKKKVVSILPIKLLEWFTQIEVNGFIWHDYLEGLYLTKMQDINKQTLITLQSGEIPNIYNDNFKRIIDKNNNRLICINKEKYSGGLDEYASTYSNTAYLESGGTENHQVVFISDHCENVTAMCKYMDKMVFNTKDRNIFKRPYGDTIKDLELQDIDIMGLVIGINQPPITKHFHWCHSMLEYIK